ncbi:MAG TPA: glycosyltransferase family 39 protein [Pyrinomonadaceae bacterium]|nr:glycosyltransferase family 39 protein [Pyrinomonadaceae bacterium]
MSKKRLLLAAVAFHFCLCVLVLAVGRLGALRGTFNADGVAVSFASDGVLYRQEAALLDRWITNRGFSLWLEAPFQLHVKIYALLFKALGWLTGHTILSIEPFNALCYAATLWLVYRLGRDAFDERAGLFAAAIVALWPSYLLHTTQFLKDPPIIAAALAFVALVSWLLKRDMTPRAALAVWAAGAALGALLWHLRREMLLIAMAASALGLAALVVRQLRARRWATWNSACAAALLLTTISTPFVIPYYRTPASLIAPTQRQFAQLKEVRAEGAEAEAARRGPAVKLTIYQWFAIYLTSLRRESAKTADSGIDVGVKFFSLGDVFRYLPRAAVVGLFAPFPSMWLSGGGQVGRAGRLLSGAETLMAYVLMLSALVGLWGWRRNPHVYLMLGVAVFGATLLAVVIGNVGTLYRMRYPFWMLLVVLGAGGLVRVAERYRTRVSE